MGKNIVERAVSPYNAANRAIQHETYGLFAPAANVNKPGMAGFDPRYFAVREQIVELSQAFLKTIQPIIREVPEQGINGMLELNSLYVNAFARVKTSTYDSHGNHSPVYTDRLGSLMVFGTETTQTQVLFAEGHIWTRKITQQGDEVTVGTFEPIASKDKVELLTARVDILNGTVYNNVHYIPEVYDTTDQMPDGFGSWHGYYLTFGKDYMCKIPDDELTPTEFKMLVEVHTGSGPEWFTIIRDPENTDSSRFCSFRIESFENSVAKYWYNGKQYEAVYEDGPGISSTTATLWCNYEVFTEEDGLPTFEYVYPLKHRIKALEKRMQVVERDVKDIKSDLGFMKNDIARVTNKANEAAEDVEGLSQTVKVLEERVDAAITANQVRQIVQEELGVIENGIY